MKIYGLAAQGRYIALDGTNKMASKKMFRTREAALAHEPEFIELCYGDGEGLTDMDRKFKVHTVVIDYELVD